MTGDDRASSGFHQFVSSQGLAYYQHWEVPRATQILRHTEFPTVPELGYGNLPRSLPLGSLAHVEVPKIPDGVITAVIVGMPASISFAVRMLCHDRSIPRSLRKDPESDSQVVELSDRDVTLESEAFHGRYVVAADHDQDETRIWQVFDPAVVDFLTVGAPAGFSFELQQGALCCFVPAALDDADALDGLCDAARLVHDRVAEIAEGGSDAPEAPADGSRDSIVERALAENPFSEPPESVWRAAHHFGALGLVGGGSWKLGREAFFRAYAAGIGFERRTEAAFRARHLNPAVIGAISHVAQGRFDDIPFDSWLLLSKGSPEPWITLAVDVGTGRNTYAFAGMPETDEAKEHGVDVIGAEGSIYFWMNKNGRSKHAIDQFLDVAHPFAAAVVREA